MLNRVQGQGQGQTSEIDTCLSSVSVGPQIRDGECQGHTGRVQGLILERDRDASPVNLLELICRIEDNRLVDGVVFWYSNHR